jgi:hypothetical protein
VPGAIVRPRRLAGKRVGSTGMGILEQKRHLSQFGDDDQSPDDDMIPDSGPKV